MGSYSLYENSRTFNELMAHDEHVFIVYFSVNILNLFANFVCECVPYRCVYNDVNYLDTVYSYVSIYYYNNFWILRYFSCEQFESGISFNAIDYSSSTSDLNVKDTSNELLNVTFVMNR